MITKIGTVGVYVEYQLKALQFWMEKVGFVEKELMALPWGKFASFLDEDGNKYGLKG
jgi:hypothetical protein